MTTDPSGQPSERTSRHTNPENWVKITPSGKAGTGQSSCAFCSKSPRRTRERSCISSATTTPPTNTEREGMAGEEPADHAALHPDLGVMAQLVEIFFGIITRQAIRRGTFTSVKDLVAAIETFIDGWNERCQPFVWTKTADQILPSTP